MGIRRRCRFATDEIVTYFTSFRLFTQHGVNKIWATVVFNKNELSKCVNVATLNRNDDMTVYIASSESSKPKRFNRRWKKVERRYIQEQ